MKRFYKTASTQPADKGWQILLDGKPVKSPSGGFLLPASEALALAIADEWNAQIEIIKPDTMHLTQLQNTLQDKAPAGQDGWVLELQAYLETDMLCYRTDHPPALAVLQQQVWTPWLQWLADKGLTPMPTTTGLSAVSVPDDVQAWLKQVLKQASLTQLLIWRHVAGLTGSCILALALTEGACTAQQAFDSAVLEEKYYSDLANEDLHGKAPHVEKAHLSLLAELEGCAKFVALSAAGK